MSRVSIVPSRFAASDERITSDGGLVLLREADHRLGLTESLAERLVDPRRQDLVRYQLVELLRERLYALALGYSAQDDADRLAHDPAMKIAVWNARAIKRWTSVWPASRRSRG